MRIYKIVQNVILIILLMVIISLGVLICIFNIRPLVVVSGSMEPAIMTGSLCFIDYSDNSDKDVAVGDIVAYKAGNITVTHRIIDVTSDGYITKGDNNDTADISPVTQEQIKGTYKFSIPNIGYWIKDVRVIVIAGMLFILFILSGAFIKKGSDS